MSRRIKFDQHSNTFVYLLHCDVCGTDEDRSQLIADDWTGNHICIACSKSGFHLQGFEEEA